ncbi:MAG: IPT/TIG domain-containing protein, partial [Thermoleophilia bacterium]|nr:IPT/TIG domain-containing protein [Thermoleophilia bacterium]
MPRSGRLVIQGTGFGTDGDVFIAGLPAWTTTWTDARVVAFVPEAAPVGSASLTVVVDGTPSNELPL